METLGFKPARYLLLIVAAVAAIALIVLVMKDVARVLRGHNPRRSEHYTLPYTLYPVKESVQGVKAVTGSASQLRPLKHQMRPCFAT
jgi:hypothetical protein